MNSLFEVMIYALQHHILLVMFVGIIVASCAGRILINRKEKYNE